MALQPEPLVVPHSVSLPHPAPAHLQAGNVAPTGTQIPESLRAPLPQSPSSWDGGGLTQHTQGKAGRTAGGLSAGKFSLRVHFTVQVCPGAMQTSSWLCPGLGATKAGTGHSRGVAPMESGEALTAPAHACLLNPGPCLPGSPGSTHSPRAPLSPWSLLPNPQWPVTPELLCKLPSCEPPWAGAGGLNLSCFKQGQVAREALHREGAGWRVSPTH